MASSSFVASPPAVLAFAHCDPTGGGGLQGDLLTLASLGIHPLTVATALTVGDTGGCDAALLIDADWVEDQARTLLEDIVVAGFKVGLLGNVEQVSAVAGILSDYDELPLVLHPAPIRLLHEVADDDELYAALRELLLPQATLLVAAPADAARLLGDDDDVDDEAAEADATPGEPPQAGTAAALLADRILASGCQAVLLTGVGGRRNLLFADGALRWTQDWEHSSAAAGETLAAALAGCIAGGGELTEAVRSAHDYAAGALAAAYRPGMGRPLPDRLFWARAGDEEEGDGSD